MRNALLLFALLFGSAIGGCWNVTPETPVSRGIAYFDDGKWDEAIQSFDAAIAQNPLNAEAFLYRGQAYMCRGREHVGQAIADYSEAIRLNPKGYEAYYHRAIAYRERGEKEKALADELVARRNDPNAEKAARLRAAPTPEEYKAAFERAAEVDRGKEADASSNEVVGAVPEFKPSAEPNDPPPIATDRLSIAPGTATGDISRKTDRDDDASRSSAPNVKLGSVTEEMLGLDAPLSERDDDERDFRPRRSWRRSPAAPDWQTSAPPLTLPSPSAERAPSHKPSPVGTLPFGNPYAPRSNDYSPNYSPYSSGPRSTGIQSGIPALPNPYLPGGTRSYGSRRFDPNSIRSNPREAGTQVPLVPPR